MKPSFKAFTLKKQNKLMTQIPNDIRDRDVKSTMLGQPYSL